MIHATFQDGSTMLFDGEEIVAVAQDVFAEEYIAGDRVGKALEVVKRGVYVLAKADSEGAVASKTRIVRVREV